MSLWHQKWWKVWSMGTRTGTWWSAEVNIQQQSEDSPDDFLLLQAYFFMSFKKFLCYEKSDKLPLHVSGINEQTVTIVSGCLGVHIGKHISSLISARALECLIWTLLICWGSAADDQCTAAACLCLNHRQEMCP